MLIILCLVLMLTVGRCRDNLKSETRTVRVGDHVNMTCDRRISGTIFWIRLISGNFPEVLGKTFSFDTDTRITTKEEPGLFVLGIKTAQLSDSAVYYCVKIHQRALEFLETIVLTVKGPNPDTTAAPVNDPVPPKDSVSPHCSVLYDNENKICPEEKCVCCLRVGPHQSPLCFNYTHGCSVYEKDQNPDKKLSTEKCLCSFWMNLSSSDAWRYHCADDTRGEALPGNTSKLNNEESCLLKNNTVISLLCAALAVSLVLIVCLVVSIKNLKKKTHAAVLLQPNAAASGFQQTDEDSLIYSAPAFKRNATKAEMRDAKSAENESIYSTVIYNHQNTAGSS
ncbi:uncharacterized protein LOC131472907 isoform X2 [Solea solea]|uniref:uncharacterized protein LOC131472907 isoform X2 n=1 Tax=Solea solea TaxID=90069 RepID=UPI00272AEC92|nr:uncharacterized protein LOC131472907 isoform X2 [Solea solea]